MSDPGTMLRRSTDGFSVVIADDDELVVEALSGLIDDHPGLWLAGASTDGHHAVQLCAAQLPDLVVLDVSMPLGGVDGLEAVRAASPTSTVVFYTAQADRRTRQRLIAAGAAAVFAKGAPIDLAGELHALVAAEGVARPAGLASTQTTGETA